MPATSRLFVKASVAYLCLGALLGTVMLIHRWIPLGAAVGYLRTIHIQALIVGWLTQLIMGVGWWLFPPLRIGLRHQDPLPSRRGQTQRGSEPLFWATFVLLNGGILVRGIFEPLYSVSKISFFHLLVSLSGLLLLAAAVAFVLNMWGRVRELGRK